MVSQGTADSPVVLRAEVEDDPWYGVIACGNGSADWTQTRFSGATTNSSYVNNTCLDEAAIQIVP